jgi:hypothetical protein
VVQKIEKMSEFEKYSEGAGGKIILYWLVGREGHGEDLVRDVR